MCFRMGGHACDQNVGYREVSIPLLEVWCTQPPGKRDQTVACHCSLKLVQPEQISAGTPPCCARAGLKSFQGAHEPAYCRAQQR